MRCGTDEQIGDLFSDEEEADFIRKHTHRGNEPDTSREAAERQLSTVSESRAAVVCYLLKHPDGRTDHEGRTDLKMPSYAKRRSDLHNAGRVEKTGEKREHTYYVDSARKWITSNWAVWRLKP